MTHPPYHGGAVAAGATEIGSLSPLHPYTWEVRPMIPLLKEILVQVMLVVGAVGTTLLILWLSARTARSRVS